MNALAAASVQIRLANEADAEKITDLINLAFGKSEAFFVKGDRITFDEVIQSLERGEFLVAEQHSELAGCVYLEPRGERTYLGLLSVDPAQQQGGLGSLLMSAAEDRWRAKSAKYIDILIVNLRADLPDFYGKRGYVITGTSPFPSDVETAVPCHFINMSKALTS